MYVKMMNETCYQTLCLHCMAHDMAFLDIMSHDISSDFTPHLPLVLHIHVHSFLINHVNMIHLMLLVLMTCRVYNTLGSFIPSCPALRLTLVIIEGDGPTLLGRNWLHHIRLDWSSIKAVLPHQRSLKDLMEKYHEVFTDELGTIKNRKAKLSVAQSATPRFHRPRSVPFAMKNAVEDELDRLEFSRKSTLGLSHAYNQLVLDEESRPYLTINTHRGLYRYTRLPFGVASAPAVFQKTMDTILQGMKGVICYIDNTLITGSTEAEHLENLEHVLQRFRQHGIRVKRNKCYFMQSSVQYLGRRIDAEGIHATDSKLKAITEAPAPKNIQELRSFLGLLNYYGRFIPNLSCTR